MVLPILRFPMGWSNVSWQKFLGKRGGKCEANEIIYTYIYSFTIQKHSYKATSNKTLLLHIQNVFQKDILDLVLFTTLPYFSNFGKY